MLGRAWEPSSVLVFGCSLFMTVGAVSPAGHHSASAEVLPNGVAIPHAPVWVALERDAAATAAEVQEQLPAHRHYRSPVVRRQAPPSAKALSPEVDVPQASASLLEPEEHWEPLAPLKEPEHLEGEQYQTAAPLPVVEFTTLAATVASAETTTTKDCTFPWNCYSGDAHPEISWAPAMKEFCCACMGRGCPTTVEGGSTGGGAGVIEPCTTAECQKANNTYSSANGGESGGYSKRSWQGETGWQACENYAPDEKLTEVECVAIPCCAWGHENNDNNIGHCYSVIDGHLLCAAALTPSPAPPWAPAAANPMEEPPSPYPHEDPAETDWKHEESWTHEKGPRGFPDMEHGPPSVEITGEHHGDSWVSEQVWYHVPAPGSSTHINQRGEEGEDSHYDAGVREGRREEKRREEEKEEEEHHTRWRRRHGEGEEGGYDNYGHGEEEEGGSHHYDNYDHDDHYEHGEDKDHPHEDEEDEKHHSEDHGKEPVSSFHPDYNPLTGPPLPAKKGGHSEANETKEAKESKEATPSTETKEEEEKNTKSTRRTILIVLGSVLGVVILAGIAFAIYRAMTKNSPQEEESTAEDNAQPNHSDDHDPRPADDTRPDRPSIGF